MELQIFISYASEDRDTAIHLYDDLEREGYRPWLDVKSLLPGTNWKEEIKFQIKKSRFVILLLSKNSIEKVGFIQKEIRDVLEALDEYPQSKIFLIPARLDNSEITHERIAQIQWVDLFPSYNSGINRILDTIRHEMPPIKSPKPKGKIATTKRAQSKVKSRSSLSNSSYKSNLQNPYDELLHQASTSPRFALVQAWNVSKSIAADYLNAVDISSKHSEKILIELLEQLIEFRFIDNTEKEWFLEVDSIVSNLEIQSMDISIKKAERYIYRLSDSMEKIRDRAISIYWGRIVRY